MTVSLTHILTILCIDRYISKSGDGPFPAPNVISYISHNRTIPLPIPNRLNKRSIPFPRSSHISTSSAKKTSQLGTQNLERQMMCISPRYPLPRPHYSQLLSSSLPNKRHTHGPDPNQISVAKASESPRCAPKGGTTKDTKKGRSQL